MSQIKLMKDGKLQLSSGRIVSMPRNALHVQVLDTYYVVTTRDMPGRVSVDARDGYSGSSLWGLVKADHSGAEITDLGLSLRVPDGVIRFPRPIFSAVETAGRYVVILQLREGVPNPIICFDSSGRHVWSCPGNFRAIASGDGSYVTGFQGDIMITIDLNSGANLGGKMAK